MFGVAVKAPAAKKKRGRVVTHGRVSEPLDGRRRERGTRERMRTASPHKGAGSKA